MMEFPCEQFADHTFWSLSFFRTSIPPCEIGSPWPTPTTSTSPKSESLPTDCTFCFMSIVRPAQPASTRGQVTTTSPTNKAFFSGQ